MKTMIMVSGGFDPLHKGHVDLISRASKFGDVWVILNKDEWLVKKKGKFFMDYNEREYIIKSLKNVKNVVKQIDLDHTVCDTIRSLTRTAGYDAFIFANGGDRIAFNTPEVDVCVELGIGLVWGLGNKIQSSSKLIDQYENTNQEEIDAALQVAREKWKDTFKDLRNSIHRSAQLNETDLELRITTGKENAGQTNTNQIQDLRVDLKEALSPYLDAMVGLIYEYSEKNIMPDPVQVIQDHNKKEFASDQIKKYLIFERAMVSLDDDDQELLADEIRDRMDTIWHSLSGKDRDYLNNRKI